MTSRGRISLHGSLLLRFISPIENRWCMRDLFSNRWNNIQYFYFLFSCIFFEQIESGKVIFGAPFPKLLLQPIRNSSPDGLILNHIEDLSHPYLIFFFQMLLTQRLPLFFCMIFYQVTIKPNFWLPLFVKADHILIWLDRPKKRAQNIETIKRCSENRQRFLLGQYSNIRKANQNRLNQDDSSGMFWA